jgi:hypothetical protein
MADAASYDFVVKKDALRQTEFRLLPPADAVEIGKSDVVLRVDRFGFTANNVTYAVFGEMMGYWSFFPAPEGWGRVPVWGFATVVRSEHPDIAPGEQVYGYLPMSSHFVIEAGEITKSGFSDVAVHRRERDAFYNLYLRTAADPDYDPAHEAEQMLLRPLFFTGFLIDDFLAESANFGAGAVVVSSASSKTSIGLAHQLFQRGRGACEVIGVTSALHRGFVEKLGIHHRVVSYDDIETLDATTPTLFVDMAGDGDVTMRVHRHFGDALRYSCQVGATHWERVGVGGVLPGPQPELFWAPGRLAKRMVDWGPDGFHARTGAAWKKFLASASGWLSVENDSGREAVERVYLTTLEGRADPTKGYVLAP